MNDIIGDMLMNKVYYSSVHNNVYLKKLNRRTKTLIKDWYLLSEYLSLFPRTDLTVYRGVKFMRPDKSYHIQPIPFSTCMDLKNAMEWIVPHQKDSFIMCIEVSSKIKYTFSDNEHEGNEVILPSGKLILNPQKKRVSCKNTNILFYTFE